MNLDAIILEARELKLVEDKPAASAKVWWLSDEHFATICNWLLSGIPGPKIAELCRKDLKLPGEKAPGIMALSRFWQQFAPFFHVCQRRARAALAGTLDQEAKAHPADLSAATLDALQGAALDMALRPGSDPKHVKAIYSLVLKARDQDLAERKLEMLERKVEAAKGVAADTTLTETDRAARFKEIFGLA
jgi:hypothetical protein